MNSVKHWNKAARAIALAAALLLAGCGADDGKGSGKVQSAMTPEGSGETQQTAEEQETAAATLPETETAADAKAETEPHTETETEEHEMTLQMTISGTAVNVKWEENESVKALKTLCKNGPLTIQMSMYGGFEQVGRIGRSLPRADVQTTTEAGDIVLYSGNQLVIFYGSNAWAYTRLGHVTDKTAQEMAELLGNGDVTVTIELK